MASQLFASTPNILWRIEDFSSNSKMVSPTFTVTGLKFRLKFSSFNEYGAEKLQLIMEYQRDSARVIVRKFNIDTYVFNGNENPCLKSSGQYNLQCNEWCIWTHDLREYEKYCTVWKITFLIIISPIGYLAFVFEAQECADKNKHWTPCGQRCNEDIGNLFNSAEHSDFTLKCGNRSFSVHKSVLSARSRFFAAMLRSDMKETNECCGTVENMEPDILEVVLRYLYSGIVPELAVDALQKVYAAADRFLVEPLQLKSFSLLVSNFISGKDSHNNRAQDYNDDEHSIDEHNINEHNIDEHNIDEHNIQPIEMDRETRKKQLLKELLMTKDWRLLFKEFPTSATEMYKPYLLPNLYN